MARIVVETAHGSEDFEPILAEVIHVSKDYFQIKIGEYRIHFKLSDIIKALEEEGE